MVKQTGLLYRLRVFLARISGRLDSSGNIKPRERGATFSLLVALMLALVTIVGAVVAWRSAVAGTLAGNNEDAGLLASLNYQEAATTASIQASQNRATHLEYYRALRLAQTEVEQGLATIEARPDITQEEINALFRPVVEKADLALTNKFFFENRYLTEDDFYDAEREQSESLAEAAQTKDLNAEPQFIAADRYRAISVALVATLIVLAISLWFFALAEVVGHSVKYVLALGGLAFLALGSWAAWAIEGGAVLADIYRTSELFSIIIGAAILALSLALIIFSLVRSRTRQRNNDLNSAPHVPLSEGEDSPGETRFKQVVTMLIASATVFAALVGWLQADSGAKGDQAIRDAQRFASEALGKESTGRALVNFQYGTAFRTWVGLLAQARTAETNGDDRAAELYRSVMTETLALGEPLTDAEGNLLESGTQTGSAPAPQLLAPPYFDALSGNDPDLAGYAADVYVTKRAELSERSDLAGGLNNAWENKANAYIVHLTLLAAALAMFGLSLSFGGLARPLFVTVGMAITLVTAGSVSTVYSEPVAYIPDSAVAAYARGFGLTYRGDYPGAVVSYNDALNLAPGYANALAGRGEAHIAMKSDEGFTAAAKDYEQAQLSGKNDAIVAGKLGWIYYLQGRFDDSIRASRQSLTFDPNRADVRLNLAIAQLASGKIEEAKAEYKAAMERAVQQVANAKATGKQVPPSLWRYLDTGGRDLEGLFFRLSDIKLSWIEAPPKSAIADAPAIQEATSEIFRDLKSMVTSLENTGLPPDEASPATFEEFSFGAKALITEDAFTFADSFTSPVRAVVMKYKYSGMSNGQNVVYKVFLNGVERPEFRAKRVWDKGESGEAEQSFGELSTAGDLYSVSNLYALDEGDYIVEMYVDNNLARIGSFDIQPAP